MPVVLVVEPNLLDLPKLLEGLGNHWKPLVVATPLEAIYALYAVQVKGVAIPEQRADDPAYEPLFSTIRLAATTSRLELLTA